MYTGLSVRNSLSPGSAVEKLNKIKVKFICYNCSTLLYRKSNEIILFTWDKRTPICDSVNAVFSYCSIELIAVQTAEKLVFTNALILSENFSAL